MYNTSVLSSYLPVELLWFNPIPTLCAHRDRESKPPEPDTLHRETCSGVRAIWFLGWFISVPNLYADREQESMPPEPDGLHRDTCSGVRAIRFLRSVFRDCSLPRIDEIGYFLLPRIGEFGYFP
jgi:hypothetical protein